MFSRTVCGGSLPHFQGVLESSGAEGQVTRQSCWASRVPHTPPTTSCLVCSRLNCSLWISALGILEL